MYVLLSRTQAEQLSKSKKEFLATTYYKPLLPPLCRESGTHGCFGERNVVGAISRRNLSQIIVVNRPPRMRERTIEEGGKKGRKEGRRPLKNVSRPPGRRTNNERSYQIT